MNRYLCHDGRNETHTHTIHTYPPHSHRPYRPNIPKSCKHVMLPLANLRWIASWCIFKTESNLLILPFLLSCSEWVIDLYFRSPSEGYSCRLLNHIIVSESECPCQFNLPTLQWRHNGRDCVSNYQPHDCLLNRLFRRNSKKTWKLRITGLLCGEFTGDRWIPRTKGQ